MSKKEDMNTNPNPGQLLLHLGANKTGSTALQNMLYTNQNLLQQFGIHYIDNAARNPLVQSGNGQDLVNLIRQGGSKNEIKRALLDFYRPDALSIISTEAFCLLSKSQWNHLFECITELKLQVKSLVYIRSPVDFYVSSYNQGVKRHGVFSDLETSVQKSKWTHLDLLQNLNDLDIQIEINVVPYDRVKNELFQSFWESVATLFNKDARGLIPEDQHVSNRSLYQEEIQLMRKINEIFGVENSKLVSDFLVEDSDFTGNKPGLSRSAEDIILHKHEQDVRWINDTFFSGDNVLTIDNENYPYNDSGPISPDEYPDPATLVQLVLYLLRHPRNAKQKGVVKKTQSIMTKLVTIRYEEQMSDGVFFDSIYYLHKNPDVMSSELTPLEHFNNWGRAENRDWRVRDLSHVTSLKADNS